MPKEEVIVPAMPTPPPAPARKAIEEHALAKSHARRDKKSGAFVPSVPFVAAKSHARWGIGHEVTEAEYDEAVRAAMSLVIR